MVELFLRRLVHLQFDLRIPRDGRVTPVEALGSDFAGVIDSHQACSMNPFGIGEFGLVDVLGGARSRAAGRL